MPWNRFLAVPVALIVEQLVEVSKFVSQDRIQQWTLEQISDIRVLVEELVEVFTHFSQDWVQHRCAEQIFEIPAISPTEIIKFLLGQGSTGREHTFIT